MDSQDFAAPYVTQEQAWAAADRIRAAHWPSGDLPVEVEEILWGVGVRLDPVASLRSAGDADALLTGDLTRIVVDLDGYMDDRMQDRMRFSLARELGHFILHGDIYRGIKHSSIEEWIAFVQAAPEDQCAYLEQHVYEFAGRLLVPPDRLREELARAVGKAQAAGFEDWEKSGDAAREYIAGSICRVFGVSRRVIEKRIIRERHAIRPSQEG